jgi:hypothetical protein
MSAIGEVDLRDWGTGESDGLLLAAGEREPEGNIVVKRVIGGRVWLGVLFERPIDV